METLTAEETDDPTPRWQAGETIDGRYLVGAIVGEGGMGVVYEAKQLPLGTRVAVKVLIHSGDDAATARFAREARAASAIGHPHIVAVRDMGTLPDGTSYYVMEHLDGRDLAAELDLVRPLPIARACRIASRTASALGAAHAAGVIHRDLKPENVFLTSRRTADGVVDDFVKVIDFGIAKLKDELALPGPTVSGVRPRDTQAGTIVGTPMYMSPEQCAGLTTDGRSDVYSLGIVLYEMLTGVVPFDGEDALDLVLRQQREAPRRLEEVGWVGPPDLSAIVMRCLEKRPDDRFQSMADLEAALSLFLVDPSPAGRAFTGPPREEQITIAAERSSALAASTAAAAAPTFTAPSVPARAFGPRAVVGAAALVGLVVGGAGLSIQLGLFARRAPPTSALAAPIPVAPPVPSSPISVPPPVALPPEPAFVAPTVAEVPAAAPDPHDEPAPSATRAHGVRHRRAAPPPAVEPPGDAPSAEAAAPAARHRPLEMVADPWGDPAGE